MPTDPTRSTTKRTRWQRRVRRRWRHVHRDVRREFRVGSTLRPQNDVSMGRQEARFRDWFESIVDEQVVEPQSLAMVERGQHWTARLTREFYEHGIARADIELRRLARRSDFDPDETDIEPPPSDEDPAGVLRRERRRERFGGATPHMSMLRFQYVSTYVDIEDAARETVKQATREYRDAARRRAPVSDAIDVVRDRVDKVGETRTETVVNTTAVETITAAMVVRYHTHGVQRVGVRPEALTARDTALAAREPVTDGGARPGVEQLQDFDEGDFDVDFNEPPKSNVRTARDELVCEDCAALDGEEYRTIRLLDGEGPLPAHPNCRCIYEPARFGRLLPPSV